MIHLDKHAQSAPQLPKLSQWLLRNGLVRGEMHTPSWCSAHGISDDSTPIVPTAVTQTAPVHEIAVTAQKVSLPVPVSTIFLNPDNNNITAIVDIVSGSSEDSDHPTGEEVVVDAGGAEEIVNESLPAKGKRKGFAGAVLEANKV